MNNPFRPQLVATKQLMQDLDALAEQEHGERGISSTLRIAVQHWIARRLPRDQIQDLNSRMLADEVQAERELIEHSLRMHGQEKLIPIVRKLAGLPLVLEGPPGAKSA